MDRIKRLLGAVAVVNAVILLLAVAWFLWGWFVHANAGAGS